VLLFQQMRIVPNNFSVVAYFILLFVQDGPWGRSVIAVVLYVSYRYAYVYGSISDLRQTAHTHTHTHTRIVHGIRIYGGPLCCCWSSFHASTYGRKPGPEQRSELVFLLWPVEPALNAGRASNDAAGKFCSRTKQKSKQIGWNSYSSEMCTLEGT
jgi:hypothetical protein